MKKLFHLKVFREIISIPSSEYKKELDPQQLNVNLTPDTAKYIKYGIAGNHAENCLLFNSELRSDFDTPEDAATAWNNFINKD